ncbi:hypothetical protein B0H10DRAFT_2205545 [Mycena sp. CBHHK59/15]|nr:hypothetical protein B0H10DRAFT_2205545 [Mycena sp. CBHHK59/15]
MPLTRFHVDVHNLFADVPSIDIAQSPFLSVTHLTLFDDFTEVWTPVTWDPCDALAYLPALTHLCMWDSISSPVVHGVLKRCLNLRMLLNAWEDFEAFRPQEVCASLSVNDPRFVMIIVEDWVYEWELAAGTGRDIWTRGLDFIASKANGEIPGALKVDFPRTAAAAEAMGRETMRSQITNSYLKHMALRNILLPSIDDDDSIWVLLSKENDEILLLLKMLEESPSERAIVG